MTDTDKILKDTGAVLFDMDGTLIDSLYVWADVDREFLGRFGYEVPEDYNIDLFGMSFIQVAEYTKKRFNLPLCVDEIMEIWNKMANDRYENDVQLKPGAYDFVKEVHRRGIRMGICTSNSRTLVEKCLGRLGLIDYMEVVLTADEITNGKPAPDIYLKAAEKLDVDPTVCLVFEDMIPGIEAGHNAGMRVCAVRDDATLSTDDEKRRMAEYYTADYVTFE